MTPHISPEVFRAAVDHMYTDTTVEMGGFFVGRLEAGRARINAAIPALRAPSSLVNLTFDHDTWIDVVNQVDERHPGEVIVGWFHSHPGHGVFLSGYDEFIQESFFVADGMVALVVDPWDGTVGWFTSSGGAISAPELDRIDPAPGAGPPATTGDTSSRARRRGVGTAAVIAAAVVALILGSVVGYYLSSDRTSEPDPERSAEVNRVREQLRRQSDRDRFEIERLQQDNAALNERLRTPTTAVPTSEPADGGDSYVVRPGDSLSILAERFLGDQSRWSELYNFRSNEEIIGELGPEGALPGSAVGRTISLPRSAA